MFHSTIHNANDRHLHWIWNEYPCHTLLDNIHVFHNKERHLHIMALEEPYLYGPSKFTTEEIKNAWGDTKVDVLLGHCPVYKHDYKWIEENDTFEILNPKRHYFPLFFLYYTFAKSTHFGENARDIPTIVPNCHWSFYCRAPRPQRYLFLELCAKQDLLKDNIYTYNKNLEKNNPVDIIKNIFDFEGGIFDYEHKMYKHDSTQGGTPDSDNAADGAFTASVFHIAGETMHEVCFWTEKTFVPLLLGKPVIVQGGEGSNKRLQDFGFKLYDNVIDYAFDDHPDAVERNKLLVDQLVKIQNEYTPTELYKATKDIAEYNAQVSLGILLNKKFIPSVLYRWLTIYKDSQRAKNGPLEWYFRYLNRLQDIC